MSWIKIDDGFATNPKIAALTDRALRTHIRALCFSARHLTDGHIPERSAREMGTKRAIDQLVQVRLWERNGDGYVIHDYHNYNPTREQVEQERAKVKERVARWRNRNRNADTGEPSNAVSTGSPVPSPINNPTVSGRAQGAENPGRKKTEEVLPRALTRILPDPILDGLTAKQADVLARAWRDHQHELRHSLGAAEKASNPTAYVVKIATRLAGAER